MYACFARKNRAYRGLDGNKREYAVVIGSIWTVSFGTTSQRAVVRDAQPLLAKVRLHVIIQVNVGLCNRGRSGQIEPWPSRER